MRMYTKVRECTKIENERNRKNKTKRARDNEKGRQLISILWDWEYYKIRKSEALEVDKNSLVNQITSIFFK